MFSASSEKDQPHSHSHTAVVGGKYDSQIHRIELTFHLRQKKKGRGGGNSFGVELLPQSEKEN